MCIHLVGGTTRDFLRLRRRYGWAASYFGSPVSALVAAGLHERRARRLVALADGVLAGEERRRCEALGVRLVSWRHRGYPAPLRHLEQPPLV
ncbi:MAG TPA: hypothetical protein VFD43_02685, partial [Planctomycetota bacterium]|nr:hypothetical protein [Planctomycetota bacterium]